MVHKCSVHIILFSLFIRVSYKKNFLQKTFSRSSLKTYLYRFLFWANAAVEISFRTVVEVCERNENISSALISDENHSNDLYIKAKGFFNPFFSRMHELIFMISFSVKDI